MTNDDRERTEFPDSLQRTIMRLNHQLIQASFIPIYRLTCPHLDFLSTSMTFYCRDCERNVIGKHVLSARLNWRVDGTIIVHGEGWANAAEQSCDH